MLNSKWGMVPESIFSKLEHTKLLDRVGNGRVITNTKSNISNFQLSISLINIVNN